MKKQINVNTLKQKLKNEGYRRAFEVLNREEIDMVAYAFYERGFENGLHAAGELMPYLLASTESSCMDFIMTDSP